MTRGILVDIARLKGVPYLEAGTAIYPEDLDAWEKQSGVRVGAGDVVIIRTGRWARRAAKGAWDVGGLSAGLHASCAAWLKKRDIAVLGSDDGSDVAPSQIEGVTHPIHQTMLIAAGIHILDCCDLEALGAACEKRKRSEFLLTIAPLAVPNGTGLARKSDRDFLSSTATTPSFASELRSSDRQQSYFFVASTTSIFTLVFPSLIISISSAARQRERANARCGQQVNG